jgi:hypothetical protein
MKRALRAGTLVVGVAATVATSRMEPNYVLDPGQLQVFRLELDSEDGRERLNPHLRFTDVGSSSSDPKTASARLLGFVSSEAPTAADLAAMPERVRSSPNSAALNISLGSQGGTVAVPAVRSGSGTFFLTIFAQNAHAEGLLTFDFSRIKEECGCEVSVAQLDAVAAPDAGL